MKPESIKFEMTEMSEHFKKYKVNNDTKNK